MFLGDFSALARINYLHYPSVQPGLSFSLTVTTWEVGYMDLIMDLIIITLLSWTLFYVNNILKGSYRNMLLLRDDFIVFIFHLFFF